MFCHQNCTKHFRRRGLSSRPPAVEKTAPCDEKFFLHYLGIYAILDRQSTCRCSSMAECQLPKLNTRVRFPSPAPQKRTRHTSCPFLWVPPPRGRLHPSGFQCSGLQSRPCAEVFTCGENARTAHPRRRPEGRLGGALPRVRIIARISNIHFNRPFQNKRTSNIDVLSFFPIWF